MRLNYADFLKIEWILAGIARIAEFLAIRSDMPSIREVDTMLLRIHFINRKSKAQLHKVTYAMQCADKN